MTDVLVKFWIYAMLLLPVFSTHAEYQSYGFGEDTEYFLIPETHIWRENPRVWTIKKYSDVRDKFTLVYALQEADCERNRIRYRSQTWVLRNAFEQEELLIDSSLKRWRVPDGGRFEDLLYIFLCTYIKETESE